MQQYIEMEWQALLDLLVKHTKDYNDMLANKVFFEEEFTRCKLELAELHAAIKLKSESQGHPMNNILPNFPEFASQYTSKPPSEQQVPTGTTNP